MNYTSGDMKYFFGLLRKLRAWRVAAKYKESNTIRKICLYPWHKNVEKLQGCGTSQNFLSFLLFFVCKSLGSLGHSSQALRFNQIVQSSMQNQLTSDLLLCSSSVLDPSNFCGDNLFSTKWREECCFFLLRRNKGGNRSFSHSFGLKKRLISSSSLCQKCKTLILIPRSLVRSSFFLT